MKYKIGDKIRVRKDLKEGREYKIYVSNKMTSYKGQIMTIKAIEDDCYILKEAKRTDGFPEWYWTDDMLENVVLTISDLQFADILTLRNGERYVYTDNHIYGEGYHYHCDADTVKADFRENLTRDSSFAEYDIMKVEREGQIIFERQDVREMTVEEISKVLGYEVKVVK